ncbi:MAG: hypothetical protein A2140_09225 [Candidatus Muproteobacteria bacterium RBG_16_62_13]|uniref:Porin domain-containing protein n=1 Tax=Candidatus Muproteobacteria bacterium RBG_16_62_13 TaxID=1817756 RepID=A0A1F6T6V2_9PROT|nr:MAG: hypothetical protein A2140_09225 [Candidatus Muproteobacteria bacterium RBG_16_62_13]
MKPGPRSVFRHTTAVLMALLNTPAAVSWAAHPLITEDTGTQGAGKRQLEATVDHERTLSNGTRETSDQRKLVLSCGVKNPLDLIVAVPHNRLRIDGSPAVKGTGDLELAAKWRFFNNQGLSFALRPGVTAPTGDEDRGLGTGKSTSGLFAIMTHDTAPWAFHLHLGRTDNRTVADERRQINHCSVAVARRFGDRLQLVADVSQETNPDKSSNTAIRSAVVGAIYSVSKNSTSTSATVMA